ncbi:MAG: exo-alpha-sialidase [Deltaproteobacteria bacterium]|nr:exo-alpha-sialidase [Deltaproteobacteria bacterium]MBW1906448.1 exo-alpha-sialidase [Deltaproteobacteria bacterium]MBW2215088.1 exo-alpha-sialidase [Deltaproteobacteria bacterium]MBW2379697.1 exo-alpha-sialidase [Deltaproteobacteria bacterium]MBW2551883.1 exo-alpha-sialidase [Deltaproteobacteria bacterium]
MRFLFGAVLVMGIAGCSSGDGGGPATMFEAGDPLAVSGASPFQECELFDDEDGAPNREVEPWISVNPNDPDHLVAAWIQDKALGLVSAVSFDQGATWEQVVIPGLSQCSGSDIIASSDPWLAFAANGDLYSVGLSHQIDDSEGPSRIVVNKSLDGGRTWSDPVTLSESDRPLVEDKPSITADPVDECRVYVGWTRFDDLSTSTSGSEGEVLFSRTIDCGQTWSEPQSLFRVEPAGLGFQTVVSPDGSVLAFFKQTQAVLGVPRSFYVMRSEDGGETWPVEPTLIADTRQAIVHPPDEDERIRSAGALFDVAVDRTTGHLAAVWEQLFTENFVGEPQVAFSQSNDGGLTWSEPVRIDQTPSSETALLNQAFVPSVEISDDGTIGITYYNFQNDTPDAPPSLTDYWFIHCHPDLADCTDRASWADPVRVTSESFDILQASPSRRGLFLGDYMGLTSFGSDFFTAFAISGPGDEQDIYFAAIRGR